MIAIIDKKKRHNVGTVTEILGLPTINATNLNHTPMKWKIDQSHLTVTLTIKIKRRKTYVVDVVMTGP